jgi:ParB-like chromosome segregation protein Spo0J
MLDVQDVQLDLENPRIKWALENVEQPTPQDIHLALIATGTNDAEGAKFEQLRDSVKSNGGIIQPIIVNRRADGSLVCIEGNTRVMLYRDFEKHGTVGDWKRIPALVYDDMPREDAHAIRLQAHLIGPRAWNPYAKAKYLHDLRNKEGLTWNQIVDLCGGRKKELQQYIDAYEDIEDYFRPLFDSDEDFDQTRFSGFIELQKSGVKQALQHAGYGVHDFAEWIKSNRIKALEGVRSLPKVLRDAEARKVFLRDGMSEAQKLIDRPDLSKTLQEANILQLSQALAHKLNVVPHEMARRLNERGHCTHRRMPWSIATLRALLYRETLSASYGFPGRLCSSRLTPEDRARGTIAAAAALRLFARNRPSRTPRSQATLPGATRRLAPASKSRSS